MGVKLGLIGYLFMKKKKFKTRIYIIIPNFSTPYNIRLAQGGVEGETILSFLADFSKQYAKVASSRQLLSLMDLSLDVYITFLVSDLNYSFNLPTASKFRATNLKCRFKCESSESSISQCMYTAQKKEIIWISHGKRIFFFSQRLFLFSTRNIWQKK